MTYALGPGPRRPTNQEALSLELVSGLLMIIAFIALGGLIIAVITHDDMERAVQGPEFQGLGLTDIRLIEPETLPDNQARFVVEDLDEDSVAAQAGLLDDDILLKVGETPIDATTVTEETLPDVLSAALTSAVSAEQASIMLEVYRSGETLSIELPLRDRNNAALEFEIPVAGDTEPFGFELGFEEAEDLTPYYAVFADENGPSNEIAQGAKLLAIDDTVITAEMSREEVLALTLDENIPEAQEDFVILVDYEFVNDRGRVVSIEDRKISKEVPPTVLIAVLDNFGFILPILLIVFAISMVVLGIRLRRYDISAARWAQVVYMWLSVGLIVYGIKEFWVQGQGGSFITDQPFSIGDGFKAFLPYMVAPIPLVLSYRWLSSAMNIFRGEESLTQRNTRFAWTLLVPTLAILVLVAARPLEQTFIKSLTDATFGTANKPIQFVGFDNYRKLLDFRPVFVECKIHGRYLVADVAVGSAAEAAGFQRGDVYLALNGVEIEDAVNERNVFDFSIEEAGMVSDFRIDSLMEADSDLNKDFNASVTEILQQAQSEGLETIEVEVSRIDSETERARKETLMVAVASDNLKALGLNSKLEAGCERAKGVKQAIQWERTEYESLPGTQRYHEMDTYRVPWNETRGVKIIAKDPQFVQSFINTIHFSVVSVLLELLVGLIIALVVNSKFAGRGLMRAAMLIPWAIPTVVSATLWQIMFFGDSTGIINKLLMDLAIIDRPREWISTFGPWMNTLIAVDVWKTSPFMALIILAGLQTIPSDIYEAADVDGAGKLRQFFQITLPLLRPTIAVALIFRTLDALRVFDVFSVLLQDDQTRPSMATYTRTVMIAGERELGYSSAVGVIIFVFIFIFSMLYMKFVGIETND